VGKKQSTRPETRAGADDEDERGSWHLRTAGSWFFAILLWVAGVGGILLFGRDGAEVVYANLQGIHGTVVIDKCAHTKSYAICYGPFDSDDGSVHRKRLELRTFSHDQPGRHEKTALVSKSYPYAWAADVSPWEQFIPVAPFVFLALVQTIWLILSLRARKRRKLAAAAAATERARAASAAAAAAAAATAAARAETRQFNRIDLAPPAPEPPGPPRAYPPGPPAGYPTTPTGYPAVQHAHPAPSPPSVPSPPSPVVPQPVGPSVPSPAAPAVPSPAVPAPPVPQPAAPPVPPAPSEGGSTYPPAAGRPRPTGPGRVYPSAATQQGDSSGYRFDPKRVDYREAPHSTTGGRKADPPGWQDLLGTPMPPAPPQRARPPRETPDHG
jgi:hypothetical protein